MTSSNQMFDGHLRRASRNASSDLRKNFVNLGNRKLGTIRNLRYEKRALVVTKLANKNDANNQKSLKP